MHLASPPGRWDASYPTMHLDVISTMAAEYLLKWPPEQTRRLIMFRVENEELFTKRKSRHMWGILIKELGLEGKMTPHQFAKKWNNLKMKYRNVVCRRMAHPVLKSKCDGFQLLKDPPAGMELWSSKDSYWRWFDLMDQAMTGRLAQGEGSVLSPAPMVEGEGSVLSSVSLGEGSVLSPAHLIKGEWPQWSSTESGGAVASDEEGGMILQNWPATATLLLAPATSEGTTSGAQNISVRPDDDDATAVSMAMVKQDKPPKDELGQERQQLEREQALLDKERLMLDREREQLGREMASVEKERVALEKEKAGVDRRRGIIDRERAVLDRERTVLLRERAALDRERNYLRQEKERRLVDVLARGVWPAVDLQHKDRLLCLWERLVDTL